MPSKVFRRVLGRELVLLMLTGLVVIVVSTRVTGPQW